MCQPNGSYHDQFEPNCNQSGPILTPDIIHGSPLYSLIEDSYAF